MFSENHLVKKKGSVVIKYCLRKKTVCLVGCGGSISMKWWFEDLDFGDLKCVVAVIS